jgi:hypothetical protein
LNIKVVAEKLPAKTIVVRILPFALFMGFIGLDSGVRYCSANGILPLSAQQLLYLYPIKTAIVGLTLAWLYKHYTEIRIADLYHWRNTLLSIVSGLIIFFFWIHLDWTFSAQDQPVGFDPQLIGDEQLRTAMIATRLIGAVVVVPLMEEIFWRSFLLRYIINPEFTRVAIGRLTWFAFLATSVLFGLEHHYIFAGIMAGVLFNLLLYRTRSIAQCILSHAIANLALGIYVLNSGHWRFW